jgi:hypothetical protein
MGLSVDIPAETFREVAEPLFTRIAGALAAQLATVAETLAAERAQGYMDKAEAMLYVGLKSERALEGWMKPLAEGGRGMPHMKIGETVKFKRSRIDAWMLTMEKNTPPLLRPLEEAA